MTHNHAALKSRQARRDAALSRPELREESTQRVFPSSPTGMGIKVVDPEVRRLVDEAVRQKRETC